MMMILLKPAFVSLQHILVLSGLTYLATGLVKTQAL